MRLVGLTALLGTSALVLSGCSFLSGPGGGQSGSHLHGAKQGAPYGAPYGQPRGFADPCQVPHAQAPIPQGCHPSQVTLGVPGAQFGGHPGGFPQEPQFGAQHATQGYGSHAGGNVHAPGLRVHKGDTKRKPRFRGALDIGAEQSFSGNLLDNAVALGAAPFGGYDASLYNEGAVIGTPVSGEVRRVSWSTSSRPRGDDGAFDERVEPTISFRDVYSTPVSVGLSGEFIASDRATLFGRVGYAASEGASGTVAVQEATVYQDNIIESYEDGVFVPPVSNGGTYYRPNTEVARVAYDFSDMKRFDLEAGGRLYMDPIAGKASGQTVTPFVGAAAGASHYNSVSFTRDFDQLFYSSAIDSNGVNQPDAELEYYNLDSADERVPTELYGAQWVPTGRLSAGMEWQVTPGAAIAFETGLRVEGARSYTNGNKGDTNVSVPVTLRGSFNF